MAVTITRTAWTDDDGSGTTGTVINNAVKTELYNQIDTALALLLPLTGGTVAGTLTVTGAFTASAASSTFASGATQFGAGIVITETTHATSTRASITLGDCQVGQSLGGDATKDLYMANASGQGLIIKITPGDVYVNNGSFIVGTPAARSGTAGTKRLDIMDGTAPTGTLAAGCSFYSTSGEMRVMDAAGNATLLSPHDKLTNEWIYDSVDTVKGIRLRVNMEQLVAIVEQLSGQVIAKRSKVAKPRRRRK